jgi:hypothetical protein
MKISFENWIIILVNNLFFMKIYEKLNNDGRLDIILFFEKHQDIFCYYHLLMLIVETN